MKFDSISRRQFLKHSAVATGAVALASSDLFATPTTPKRTAVDQVTLGNTGIKLSRLGMGTGSANGAVQTDLGQKGFNDLVHYAYDQGITYFDCAAAYKTFDWIGDAIKPLPREKLYIQSKIMGAPSDVLKEIDRHRKTFQTDYIDSLLVHCVFKEGWTDELKRVMDSYEEAKGKKWIRAKGVSCHSLPALRLAVAHDWPEVHLVRVNPQGRRTDGMEQNMWNDDIHEIAPVLTELKTMHTKGRGVIGMKIMGNGEFLTAADREKSVRFAMARPELSAVVIGFKSKAEIDDAIKLINAALAEG